MKLAPTQASDASALYALKNSAAVLESIPGDYPLDWDTFNDKFERDLAAGHTRKQAGYTIWVDGVIAGQIGHFHREEEGDCEVGYYLGEAFWGRGLATAALLLCLDELRAFGISQVHGGHDAKNLASGRVLEKAGFRPNGETPFTMPDGTIVMDKMWVREL